MDDFLKKKLICGIHYYNTDSYDVGIIIHENDDELIFISFNIYGEYDGIEIKYNDDVEYIEYRDKYLTFIRELIDLTSFDIIDIKSREELFEYAMKNDKILSVEINGYRDYIKLLSFDGTKIEYRAFSPKRQLNKRVYKKDIYDFDIIEIDSKYDRLLEDYLNNIDM